jgi:putative SOS response-associated peptidase YedK
MPVILDPENYDLWLDPGMRETRELANLLRPFDAQQMRSYPVSTRINTVANDDEESARPAQLASDAQNTLF